MPRFFSHPAQPHRLRCVGLEPPEAPLAYQSGQTIYHVKRGLPHDYLVQQLKNPSVEMVLA